MNQVMPPGRVFDVVVVGGGLAGSLCAGLLRRNGLDVAILSPQRLRSPKARSNTRRIGECLSPGAIAQLESTPFKDLMDHIPAIPVEHRVSYWGDDRGEDLDSLSHLGGLGVVVDRAYLDSYLFRDAVSVGVIRIQGRFSEAKLDQGRWTIPLEDGCLESYWIVDASGRRRVVGSSMGSSDSVHRSLMATYSYGSLRPRAYIGVAEGRSSVIASCPEGWWYGSPLPDGSYLLMQMTDTETASDKPTCHLPESLDQYFEANSIAGTGRKLGESGGRQPWRRTVASMTKASRVCGSQWTAIGDATMTLDPILSQGMLHAIYTARTATDSITQVLEGDCEPLASYVEANRRIWQKACRQSNLFYAMENRWAGQPFWKRQHALATGLN